MRISPLLLTDYFTVHLAFFAIPDFDRKSNIGASTIDVDDLDVEIQEFSNQESRLKRALQITIDLKESGNTKYPYDFSISLLGYFEISETWPVESVDTLFSSNAPALLYSAARHAIATATGNGPYKKIVLPSVTFVESSAPVKPSSKSKNKALASKKSVGKSGSSGARS